MNLFDRARSLRWSNRLAEAETLYRRALARSPAPERALYLAECLMRRGRALEVLRVLERAAERAGPPRSAEDAVRLFRLRAMSLDFEGARREAEGLLRRTRAARHVEGLLWLILVDEFPFAPRPAAYLRRAAASLNAFVERRPRSPWGWYWRGLTRELMPGKRAAALADLRRAAALARGRTAFLKYRWALEAGDLAGLRAAARAARPGGWKPQCAVVEALALRGRRAEARRELARLERLLPRPDEPGDAVEARGHADQLRLLVESGRPKTKKLDEVRWIESRRPRR